MPLFLSGRDTNSTERMDDPNCDRQALINTYRQFGKINALISCWKHIYENRIKPLYFAHREKITLLDIGFGGGDIPINLSRWARRDQIPLHITAIETDRRAFEFVQTLDTPPNITFLHCSSTEMVEQGRRFDVVISNHLLHHLSVQELKKLLDESEKLCTAKVLFNDIERSDVGYLLFNLLSRPLFRSSFITQDGLTSIKRSYTQQELQQVTPGQWNIERLFPYRLLLTYTPSNSN